jgi:hypothetical protein
MMMLLYVLIGAAFIAGCWWCSNLIVAKLYGEEFESEIQIIDKPSDDELKKLTKAQIEEVGREYGVELDKRKTKANMIKQFNDLID